MPTPPNTIDPTREEVLAMNLQHLPPESLQFFRVAEQPSQTVASPPPYRADTPSLIHSLCTQASHALRTGKSRGPVLRSIIQLLSEPERVTAVLKIAPCPTADIAILTHRSVMLLNERSKFSDSDIMLNVFQYSLQWFNYRASSQQPGSELGNIFNALGLLAGKDQAGCLSHNTLDIPGKVYALFLYFQQLDKSLKTGFDIGSVLWGLARLEEKAGVVSSRPEQFAAIMAHLLKDLATYTAEQHLSRSIINGVTAWSECLVKYPAVFNKHLPDAHLWPRLIEAACTHLSAEKDGYALIEKLRVALQTLVQKGVEMGGAFKMLPPQETASAAPRM